MKVDLPHSLDFHSAEVNPGTRYTDLAPGKSMHYRFVAKHPGVFMYHCATQPVLMHTGAGMVGMMVVKPKGLAPVDKELWMTQQEYYIGKPGKDADMAKMQAKKPDVIAFNGYANQYKDNPIDVKQGRARPHVRPQRRPEHLERLPRDRDGLRHRTIEEGTSATTRRRSTSRRRRAAGSSSRSTRRAPTRSSPTPSATWSRARSASLQTTQRAGRRRAATTWAAPPPAEPPAGEGADVNVTLGDMWIKTDRPTVKAGKVTFAVKNKGATMHGLAIAPAPAKVDGGMVDESALLANGKDLDGRRGRDASPPT